MGIIYPYMNGIIIVFRILKHVGQKRANDFCKKFYGQETSCQRGKYKYRRKGILDDIPHRKLIRGVIVFKKDDAKKAISFLKSYNAEMHIRKAELTKDDEKILRQYSEKSGQNHQ